MNKPFKILFPSDHPSLVRTMGHHFYEGKPFSESFFLIFTAKLTLAEIREILEGLYSFKNPVDFLNEGNNFIGYTLAFPVVYGQEFKNLSFLYFTGSNKEAGFSYKGNNFSKEEIERLLK